MGVALLVGGADSFFAMQRVREGWTRWIPSTVLVCIVPASAPDLNTDLGVAINCRSYSLWSWQSGTVAARQLWFAKEDDLRECIHTRPLWVEGAPIRFEARVPNKLTPCVGWWEVDVVSEVGPPVHLYSIQRALRPPGVSSCWFGTFEVPESLVWQGLPVGDVAVPVTIRIEGPCGVSRSLKHTVRFTVVSADRRILKPFNDSELATTIESSLYVTVKKGDEPSITIRTLPDEIWKRRAALPGTYRPAIGIQIEVCDAGRVVARFDEIAGEYLGWGQASRLDDLREIAADRDGTFLRPEVLARLVLRVRGDQGVSMKDLVATDYWSGEFTVPLAEVMERVIPAGYQSW